MVGNSTRISNRLFRTQRFINMIIVGGFIVLLLITSLAAHNHVKNNRPEAYQMASERISNYYNNMNQLWGTETGQTKKVEGQEQAEMEA